MSHEGVTLINGLAHLWLQGRGCCGAFLVRFLHNYELILPYMKKKFIRLGMYANLATRLGIIPILPYAEAWCVISYMVCNFIYGVEVWCVISFVHNAEITTRSVVISALCTLDSQCHTKSTRS